MKMGMGAITVVAAVTPIGYIDLNRPGAVGEIGGRKVHHQEPPVRIDRDVALASHDPLAAVEAPLLRRWSLDGLAVEHATLGTCVTPPTLPVKHRGDVMDRPEQHQPDKSPEPPVNGLSWWKILRQHPPAATGARHVANGVEDLAQIHARLAPAPQGRLQ